MERYSEYKDSGVQWLGEIPGHWKRTRLKNVMKLLNGRAYLQPELQEEGKYRILRVGNFFTNDKWYYSDMELEPTKYCEKGDLLFAWSASFGPYIWDEEKVIYHYHIWKVLLGEKYDKYYAYFMFKAFSEVKRRDVHGSTMVHLTLQDMNQSYIPLPPLSEQRSIVSYLDDKCGKIDKMLEGKQKQIELLAEMKQRIIADAVTRGLNPDVKMKATNIPWLPEIPEHWNCIKLKAFSKDNKEKNKGNVESCVLSLSYGNVIVKQNVNFGLVPDNYENYQIVKPGYIILRLTDLQNDHKSLRTGLVKNRGIITSAYVGLVVNNINHEYVHLLLHSYDVMKVFYGMGGGLRQSMSYQDISNLYIPVPPLSEQHAIVSYITDKTSKIDTLTSKLQQEIESIKEYKQRLISDVVTGQIKVC